MTSRLSESDVRSAIDVAMETTGYGDGGDERQELNFELLTRALNDLLEQNESDDWRQHHNHFHPSPDCHLCRLGHGNRP